jgi:CDP-paratose 2-epimerase
MVNSTDIAVITGSAGLIGGEAARFLHGKGFTVIGIDNDMRKTFFGAEASTEWNRRDMESTMPRYRHYDLDIRDREGVAALMSEYGRDVRVVIHTAAQPSHDWAANDPMTDFSVNALGTLILLESTRLHAPQAAFIFTSTNKVYGDSPNTLPLIELEQRWEVDQNHPYYAHGIDELMSIDQSKHSVFGASKVAADVLVQEYGRYFGMKTACFRGGCLTGPKHSGTKLHGFLSYLMRCAITGEPYTIFGYKGKQVRDNIHSYDLVNMFWHFILKPRCGEVYNAGGSRHSNCSVIEAISLCEQLTGRKMIVGYAEKNRVGDHIWWISDVRKFQSHYPEWQYRYNLSAILREIHDELSKRL